MKCFNSLQTGKRIQRRVSAAESEVQYPEVSIPFKRESVSKAAETASGRSSPLRKFQFPSNGKAYPKAVFHLLRRLVLCFNSLQTGKRIQRSFKKSLDGPIFCVSIPFKRESVSKVEMHYQCIEMHLSFNSLQTGKRIQR